jgi:hypothetical protein
VDWGVAMPWVFYFVVFLVLALGLGRLLWLTYKRPPRKKSRA